MLSRCNFCVITLANVRFNTLKLHRPFMSCTVCLANKWITPSCRLKQQPCSSGYNRIGVNFRLPKYYTSNCQPPTSTTPPTSPPPIIEDDKSQNIFQRFKNMAKQYWYIVLPVHLVTSTVWFGSFYFIASSGVDVPALLETIGLPDWIIDKVRDGNSWTSYLVIAYGLYKIFTPLRYMVTLGGTSMTIRYIQKLGYKIRNTSNPKKS